MKRNCNECNSEYEAEPRYLNRGQGLFCSISCSSVYHGRARSVKHEPNTQCAWCGIDFYRKPSIKLSKSGLYYCCKDHQTLGVSAGQYKVGPGGTLSYKECVSCGKRCKPKDGLCKICHRENTINLWLNGDNSVTLYRSKTTGLPVDTANWVKDYLIIKRGDRCESCGFNSHGPSGSIIQMDHINGNCFDNRPENLKLLCPNCHAMTSTYGSRNKGSGRAHRRKNGFPARTQTSTK